MPAEFEARCRQLVVELGLGKADDVLEVRPLLGGVASDIAWVQLIDREICVKFALAKLKVAENWQAPLQRNTAEYAWLGVAANLFPESAVKLFGHSNLLHGFAMEFVVGRDVYLWKDALLGENENLGEAKAVGDLLGRIHAVSTRSDFDRAPFQNRDDFRALRIDPYISFTGRRHQDLSEELTELADMLYSSTQVLVHGDVSPKNILFRGQAPILLDAECATIGDSSFDPAFCLNHLILKAAHKPLLRDRCVDDFAVFWQAYSAHVDWEDRAGLEARICRLLPALMLARVDGKSPVEYLTENENSMVRKAAISQIQNPPSTLGEFVRQVISQFKGTPK